MVQPTAPKPLHMEVDKSQRGEIQINTSHICMHLYATPTQMIGGTWCSLLPPAEKKLDTGPNSASPTHQFFRTCIASRSHLCSPRYGRDIWYCQWRFGSVTTVSWWVFLPPRDFLRCHWCITRWIGDVDRCFWCFQDFSTCGWEVGTSARC